jgi:hypothetical protein
MVVVERRGEFCGRCAKLNSMGVLAKTDQVDARTLRVLPPRAAHVGRLGVAN